MAARSVPTRTMPTVVVARRARPGLEDEFEQWLQRLQSAAQHAPGHIRSHIQPPNPQHPDEWVIIYQFDSVVCRNKWIDSDVRRELMFEGADLVDGAPREQVLAMAPETDPVTAVASFRLRPDGAAAFVEFTRRLHIALEHFDGYQSCTVFDPVPGVQDDAVLAFSFDTRMHLDAWLESRERATLLEFIDPHLAGDRVMNVVGSFGGWFEDHADHSVKRWKQASVILLALFPTTLVLTLLRGWLIPDVALVPSVLISNVIGICILTWGLMPILTKAFDGWLRK